MGQYNNKDRRSTIKVDNSQNYQSLNMTQGDGFAKKQQDDNEEQEPSEPLQGFGDYEAHEEE